MIPFAGVDSGAQVLRDRFLQAQLEGDRRAALALLGDGALACEVWRAVIGDAQREIGRLWQEDRISIAEEHMATAIAQLALAHLYERATPAPPLGRSILVACVEGELHDFPARLVADALDEEGFAVRFLGASVPTDSLIQELRREPPSLLALSVTMTFNLPALREAVTRARAELPALPIAVGGHACTWSAEVARELGADLTAQDAGALARAARQLLVRS